RRKLCLRLDAQNVVALGIENCTYRHWRLLEVGRAVELALSCVVQVINQQSGADVVGGRTLSARTSRALAVLWYQGRRSSARSRVLRLVLQLPLTAPREEVGREIRRIAVPFLRRARSFPYSIRVSIHRPPIEMPGGVTQHRQNHC